MSTAAVKAYRAGNGPPADVFNRVVDIVDRFIDFNKSLADQRTMAELVACYILATWFLDALTSSASSGPTATAAAARRSCPRSLRS